MSAWDRLKDMAKAATPEAAEIRQISEELEALVRTNGEAIMERIQAAALVHLNRFVTKDPQMIRMKQLVLKLCARTEPVLITGPTGTGKELIAQALGAARSAGRIVPVNCGGLTPTLVASTFFGCTKGAYTGATEDRDGVFVRAANGVVFLDEIAELPLDLQAMLLRAIQENHIVKVGDVKEVRINCRFVAATKYDLRKLVYDGKFREDLFARLMTFEVKTTGLEDRQCDIMPIAESMGWEPKTPIPDCCYDDIYRFNCRAIRTLVARYDVDPAYYGLA